MSVYQTSQERLLPDQSPYSVFLARRQYTDILPPSNNNKLLVEGQPTIKIKVETYGIVFLDGSDMTWSSFPEM